LCASGQKKAKLLQGSPSAPRLKIPPGTPSAMSELQYWKTRALVDRHLVEKNGLGTLIAIRHTHDQELKKIAGNSQPRRVAKNVAQAESPRNIKHQQNAIIENMHSAWPISGARQAPARHHRTVPSAGQKRIAKGSLMPNSRDFRRISRKPRQIKKNHPAWAASEAERAAGHRNPAVE